MNKWQALYILFLVAFILACASFGLKITGLVTSTQEPSVVEKSVPVLYGSFEEEPPFVPEEPAPTTHKINEG